MFMVFLLFLNTIYYIYIYIYTYKRQQQTHKLTQSLTHVHTRCFSQQTKNVNNNKNKNNKIMCSPEISCPFHFVRRLLYIMCVCVFLYDLYYVSLSRTLHIAFLFVLYIYIYMCRDCICLRRMPLCAQNYIHLYIFFTTKHTHNFT